MDPDLESMDRERIIMKLKTAIRGHRDASGQALCWHHPAMWSLLPEKVQPSIAVLLWPKFLRGCIRYRQSLDEQALGAPVHDKEYDG